MTRLHKMLLETVSDTVTRHRMIENGDRIVVGISGGKDSLAAWRLLRDLQEISEIQFELFPVHVDAGYSAARTAVSRLEDFFREEAVQLHSVKETFGQEIIAQKEKNPCFPCSRKRREHLFRTAQKLKCCKVILAHHRDDVLETLLLNLFFSREIATILPVQPLFQNQYAVIRPLWSVEEKLLTVFAREQDFPVIPNPCPFAGHTRRQEMKQLLNQLAEKHKRIRENLFAAIFHVNTAFLPDQPFPPSQTKGA